MCCHFQKSGAILRNRGGCLKESMRCLCDAKKDELNILFHELQVLSKYVFVFDDYNTLSLDC